MRNLSIAYVLDFAHVLKRSSRKRIVKDRQRSSSAPQQATITETVDGYQNSPKMVLSHHHTFANPFDFTFVYRYERFCRIATCYEDQNAIDLALLATSKIVERDRCP